MKRPRYDLTMFALTAATLSGIRIHDEVSYEKAGQRVALRPGRLVTDSGVIAELLALPTPPSYHIPRNIVIAEQSAAGAFASGYIQIGGTVHTGDVINVTLNGHALASGYTVAAGDTFASIAAGVARLILQDSTDNAIVSCYAIGPYVILTALASGSTGNYTLTTAVTGGGNTTTATANAAALSGSGIAIVQGQPQIFTPGQVIADPTMVGVVAQALIPYTLAANLPLQLAWF